MTQKAIKVATTKNLFFFLLEPLQIKISMPITLQITLLFISRMKNKKCIKKKWNIFFNRIWRLITQIKHLDVTFGSFQRLKEEKIRNFKGTHILNQRGSSFAVAPLAHLCQFSVQEPLYYACMLWTWIFIECLQEQGCFNVLTGTWRNIKF